MFVNRITGIIKILFLLNRMPLPILTMEEWWTYDSYPTHIQNEVGEVKELFSNL